MTGEKELLTYIDENIHMGLEALTTLEKQLEKTDNKIKSAVSESLGEYKKFEHKCKALLGESDNKKRQGNLFQVIMSKMSANQEFAKDNSDTHIADMLIQGYNMGIIDITKKLKKYKKEITNEVFEFAVDYREMMERRVEEMKEFL